MTTISPPNIHASPCKSFTYLSKSLEVYRYRYICSYMHTMIKLNVSFSLLICSLIAFASTLNILALADEQHISRCPQDFDDEHPYNPEREKQIYEMIVKRSKQDVVIKGLLQLSKNKGIIADQNITDGGQIINVPVVFHVMTPSTNFQPTPISAIKANIDIMNKGFAGLDGPGGFADSKIRFTLQAVTVTVNKGWFENCAKSKAHSNMKYETATNTSRYLNVWICKPGKWLGFAYLPQYRPEDDVFNGVVLNYLALPKVPGYEPIDVYNEGDTLTHEVGHHFGLLHTFSGKCGAIGDEISDTAAEKSPAFGASCEKDPPRDTCPKQPGVDPVTNFMDYSYDRCLNNFTPLQAARMRTMLFEYRPTLAKNQPRECVTGGNMGNVGSWKICKSKCYTNKTPSGLDAPKGGWCMTDAPTIQWGDCCCLENGCTPKDNIYGMN